MLLLLAQATPLLSSPSNDVVVIGRRAEMQLAACLARNCPPAEEVEASLQASTEQFADGRYSDARRTLQNAIRRNRHHAARMPGPVSTLYATLTTVAEHEGDVELARSSARNNVSVLRRHLGEGHESTLGQELAFGDSMVGLGSPDVAGDLYRSVQRKATESGQSGLAADAAFRRAWLALMRGRDRDAERLADEAVAIAGSGNRLMTEWRDVLRARIAVHRGDESAVDALALRLRQSATHTPRLLFSDPVENINPVRFGAELNPWHDSRIRFADVGYWIRPDGRTASVELLRTSGLGQWTPGIFRQVGSRRYVPLDVAPGHPGIYRIDRFTVRAARGMLTGTRVVQRTGNLTVQIVDLTETDAMNAEHRQRTLGASSNRDN